MLAPVLASALATALLAGAPEPAAPAAPAPPAAEGQGAGQPSPSAADASGGAEGAPRHRVGSVQGGETLGVGGTVMSFSAGYSTFSGTWAQGFSDTLDLGLVAELDWATTELVAGGLLRQDVGRIGDVVLAWRARAGFYASMGSTWVVATNHAGAGLQLQPGLAASLRLGNGLASAFVDAPMDLTVSGGGFALGVRGGMALELPLGADVSLGARAGLGTLVSTSGAPFADDSPRGIYDVSALLTFQLL